MSSPERFAAPISASIEMLRRQFGLGRTDTLATLTRSWSTLAGEQVAERSKVIDLRQGRLTVDAYDPATAEVLTWSRQRLLEAARAACPDDEIVDLTVRVRRPERPSKR